MLSRYGKLFVLLAVVLLTGFCGEASAIHRRPQNLGNTPNANSTLFQEDPLLEKRLDSNCVQLVSAYPWETVKDNVKTYKYIIINFRPDLFDPKKVDQIAKNLEKYVSKYVYPTWRQSVEISTYTPPSLESITNYILDPSSGEEVPYLDPIAQSGTYIPIYLTDEFSSGVPNNFSVAVHGCVSDSVMTGFNAFTYLPDYLGPLYYPGGTSLVNPVPYGIPFIVIPFGSAATGNGITSAVAANTADPSLGPTDPYQCFSLALSHEVIEVLINPTGVHYCGSGDPLGEGTTQFFLLREAVDPFSQGTDNIFNFHGWSMCNFAFPAYFFPYNTSGIYDFLGNATAPFTPYKGNQFFLYQTALGSPNTTTDMLCGSYVSSPSNPGVIQMISNGSIYTYTGWGLKSGLESGKPQFSTEGVQAKRQQSWNQVESAIASSKLVSTTNSKSWKKKSKYKPGTSPQLLPFQYLDSDGIVTSRIYIINYLPDLLPPDLVDSVIPTLNRNYKERFAPWWNAKPKIVANYTIYSDADLPVFDGTFIPFFYLPTSHFLANGVGQPLISEGSFSANLNNVPNILAGPLISDYLNDPPALPLGNPYLLNSEGFINFLDTGTAGAIQVFCFDATHEGEELCIDPTYADYIATSNPPVDLAILFSQRETADPVEDLNFTLVNSGIPYLANPLVLPAYFSAGLRASNYDATGIIYRALVPGWQRQQIVYQQQGQPLHWAWVFDFAGIYADVLLYDYIPSLTPTQQAQYTSVLPYLVPDSLWLNDLGNIFDPDSFYNLTNLYDSGIGLTPIIPQNMSPIGTPVVLSPLNSIYTDLLKNHTIVVPEP